MAWFGGLVPSRGSTRWAIPEAARLWLHQPAVWTVGEWPAGEVRAVDVGDAHVMAFGPCSASDEELRRCGAGIADASSTAWSGCFTLALVHADRVDLVTDLAWGQPLYTVRLPGGIAWGSSSRALAGLVGIRVDADWLATSLLAPGVSTAFVGRSAFAGVELLPPGAHVALTGGRIVTQPPKWRPTQDRAAAAAHFARALRDGVALRSRSPGALTVDCSGGLDSATLCLLAVDAAGDDNAPTAVTLHPAGVRRGGDFDFVPHVVAARPALRHRWVPLDDAHLPFTALDEVPATDEPAPSTSGYARFTAQFDVLRQLGSEAHLTGDGGDTLLCPPLLYLADLLRCGRWMRAFADAVGWARVRRVSPWPLVAGAVTASRLDHGSAVVALADAVVTGLDRGPSRLGGLDRPTAAWYQPADAGWRTTGAGETAAAVLRQAARRDMPAGLDHAGQLTLSALHTVGRTARADIQLAAAHGIRLHNPYLDSRVLDAVLAVPAWQTASPATFKPLLHAAFPALLPAKVAARSTKGSYETDHYRGVRANLTQLRRLVDGRLAALGLVDPAPLRRALDQAAMGMPVPLNGLEQVAATEAWLAAVTSAAPTRWEPRPAAVIT